jgi:type II secretory pathway component PulC
MFGELLLAAALAAAPWPQSTESLPLTTLPLRLTGVAADAAPAGSACLIRCTDLRAQGIYSPGQLACGVAVIDEIRAEGVVVRNIKASRREWLTFATASDPKPPVAAARAPETEPAVPVKAAPSPLTMQVAKAAVERHLANLSEVLDSALALPHYRGSGADRTIDGFEISRVTPGGAADEIGLRDGDILLEVNGQPLNGVAAAMQLLGQARSLTEARVVLSRGGERVPLVISVK